MEANAEEEITPVEWEEWEDAWEEVVVAIGHGDRDAVLAPWTIMSVFNRPKTD